MILNINLVSGNCDASGTGLAIGGHQSVDCLNTRQTIDSGNWFFDCLLAGHRIFSHMSANLRWANFRHHKLGCNWQSSTFWQYNDNVRTKCFQAHWSIMGQLIAVLLLNRTACYHNMLRNYGRMMHLILWHHISHFEFWISSWKSALLPCWQWKWPIIHTFFKRCEIGRNTWHDQEDQWTFGKNTALSKCFLFIHSHTDEMDKKAMILTQWLCSCGCGTHN